MTVIRARPTEHGKVATGCLIALGVVVVLAVGGGYALYKFGIGMVEDEIAADLADHPVVKEHLGEIREIEFDVGATAEVEVEDRFVFHVVGSHGSGRLEIAMVTGEDDLQHVTAGTLTLDDGSTHDLFPEPTAEPEEGAEPAEGNDGDGPPR